MALDALDNLPDISFIDNMTLTDAENLLVKRYQEMYERLTGKPGTLARANPMTLLLYATATYLYQQDLRIDYRGKMNLLKYSKGAFLDHVAAIKRITRNGASAAVVTMRFTLSDIRSSVVTIPEGTRVQAEDIFFETIEYAEIEAGETSIDILCQCMTEGVEGNGFEPGAIITLVDPIPYVASVINVDTSAGGADVESDDSLRERVYLAPAGFSTAGASDSYIYWAKSFSSAVSDVVVDDPEPGDVVVSFLVNGEVPTPSIIDSMYNWLNDKTIRPLTDHLTVQAPDIEYFEVELTYYINSSDYSKVTSIQNAVVQAVDEYIAWQTSAIGRDLNPDELIKRVVAAGAKRVEVVSPVYTPITGQQVSSMTEKSVTYGGLEDD